MSHVKFVHKFSDQALALATEELTCVDWDNLPQHGRTDPVFSTSRTLHFRVHDPSQYVHRPDRSFILNCSEILDCVDTEQSKYFPYTIDLALEIINVTKATRLGRLMAVLLLGQSTIPLHVDPGPYFRYYSRFHLPLKTNRGVEFLGPPGTKAVHMEQGSLYELDNTSLHGVVNRYSTPRLHLIFDLKV